MITDTEGLYRTTDAGSSWLPIHNTSAGMLAFDPTHPGWVFGSVAPGHQMVSHDYGTTWIERDAFSHMGNQPVAAAVTDAGIAYVADIIDGIARSGDGGATWTQANRGLPALSLSGTTLLEFAITSTTPSVAYAVLDTGAVYRSADGGTTWSLASGSVPACGTGDVGSLTISPTDPDTAYLDGCGGVYRTRDGGASWRKLSGDFLQTAWWSPYPPIVIDPASPDTLYAAAGSGIIRSNDGGTTWTTPTSVLGDSQVETVSINPKNPTELYAGTAAGIFRSVDGGETWQPDDTDIQGRLNIWGVASDPADPSLVYAATESGVWRSSDAGHDWHYASQGLHLDDQTPPIIPTSITVNPGDPSTLYTEIHGGFAVSHDHANTWSMLPISSVYTWASLAVDPDNPLHLIAPTEDGVATSLDGGQTWSTTTLCTLNCIAFERVAFAPSDPSVVYVAGGYNGVWRSTDGGDSWTQVTHGTTTPWNLIALVLAVDPQDPNTVVYQTLPPSSNQSCFGQIRKLQISHDGGQTWHNGRTCLSSAFFEGDGANSTLYGTNVDTEYESHDDGATVIPAANSPLRTNATGLAPAGRLHIAGRTASRAALYVSDNRVIRRPFVAKPPNAFLARLPYTRQFTLRLDSLHVHVGCSASWHATCHGRIVLQNQGTVVAATLFSLPVGRVKSATLHLSARAWRILGATHRRTYTAHVISHGPDLTLQTQQRNITLIRPA